MNNIALTLIASLTFGASGCVTAERGVIQGADGPYLNQSPPGKIPEAFAPGMVSTEKFEYGGVFSPDMNEFYVIREVESEAGESRQEFVVFELEDNRWKDTVISPRIGQPFVSPDGTTMHLGKRYKTRTEGDWSEIEELGTPFDDYRIMRLTASSNGTYYFDEVGTDGDGKIRYSEVINGERTEPRLASESINSGTWLAHPFIAPDESYILWDGRKEGGYGSSDIYVSFRQQDGEWGSAINLGNAVNTDAWEASASVTPDGEYLFFHRNVDGENVDIFWVDAEILEDLRPDQ
ncbi:MAG: hypothetical protein AAFY34_03860 [Pseudomonadota bacterium]